MRRSLLAVPAIVLLLQACGGGGGGGQHAALPAVPAGAQSVTASFKITIPSKLTSSGGRSVRAVSNLTQSVSIAVNAGTAQLFNIAGNPACAAGPPIVCTFSVVAPVGPAVFVVNTYDQPNGAGTLLNTGGTTTTIMLNAANNIAIVMSDVTVTSLADSGKGSLRDAISNAVDGEVIGFATGGTIVLTGGPLVLSANNVTIEGPAADGTAVTLDGNNTQSILSITGSAAAIFGLTFSHANSNAPGSALNAAHALLVANTTFSHNITTDSTNSCTSVHGGGAVVVNGPLIMSYTTFDSNSNTGLNGFGGGLSTFSDVAVIHSTFTNNSAPEGGAWVICGNNLTSPRTLLLDSSTFTGNTAMTRGSGAIADYAYSSGTSSNVTFTVTNSTFTGNSAMQDSGAMEIDSDHTTVSNSIFQNNVAHQDSGVAEVDNSPTSFVNDTFTGNQAFNDSGVSEIDDASSFTGCTFLNNTAIEGGGALEIDTASTITASSFTGNSSTGTLAQHGGDGGAIAVYDTLTLINSSLSGNSAVNYGGAIFAAAITTITGTTISGNAVTGSAPNSGGGAMFIENSAAINITNSTLASNSATNGYGGGIFNAGGATALNFDTVALNSAGIMGGNLYNQLIPNPNVASALRHPQRGRIHPQAQRATQAIAHAMLSISNSIVSGGSAPSGLDILNNDVMNGADNNVFMSFNGTPFADTPANNALGVSPLLGALQNNGGTTMTMGLGAGSPAIGRVPGSACSAVATDQRGHSRTAGATCDSGAYQTP